MWTIITAIALKIHVKISSFFIKVKLNYYESLSTVYEISLVLFLQWKKIWSMKWPSCYTCHLCPYRLNPCLFLFCPSPPVPLGFHTGFSARGGVQTLYNEATLYLTTLSWKTGLIAGYFKSK